MTRRVPAYKDFLKSHSFSPGSVKSMEDFSNIPPVNKDNYLRKYPKEMLCWDGEFSQGQWVISTTSGSTGQPYYFPRERSQDWQYAISAELYLRNNFQVHKKSTLYIVAFPMGAWIGGLFTYEALKIVSQNSGYQLSVITPGIHKQEVINAVKQLGSSFDQIIIGAYAPFLKDILDDGTKQGIDWSKLKLGFVFSAEAFTERFRDFIFDIAKPDDPLLSTLNHYGTVDLGTMAHETPESVLIRRAAVQEGVLGDVLPEARRQPTLAQYDPNLFYFEEEAHNLLCTAYSGLPLVRYDLKDYGGALTRNQLHDSLDKVGLNVPALIKESGISDTTWNLPFVYVYERNDFSLSYYAFLIYPDMIRRALQQDELRHDITGKFSALVDYSVSGRQELIIHIESKTKDLSDASLQSRIQSAVHTSLLEESSEYRETFKMTGDVVKPTIRVWPYEDQEHFMAGAKQKWIKK